MAGTTLFHAMPIMDVLLLVYAASADESLLEGCRITPTTMLSTVWILHVM